MSIFSRIHEDIQSVLERDPAARSSLEVLLCYPGLWAVWAHKATHRLWQGHWYLTARLLSQMARHWTGVEIHPGATIGRRLFIDHGIGVVIGETSIIGDDVTLYQGVTLGGTSSARSKKGGKRHPTIENGVFIGNNANILGNITVGANSRIGAGSVVLQDVPPDSTAVGVPAHILYREGRRILITDPHEIKDPLSNALIAISERVDELEAKLGNVQKTSQTPHSFTTEEAEREAYRSQLDLLRHYVSGGEGI